MRLWYLVAARLRSRVRRRQRHDELDEELRLHLAQEIEQHVARDSRPKRRGAEPSSTSEPSSARRKSVATPGAFGSSTSSAAISGTRADGSRGTGSSPCSRW